jgi:type VI secretion system protein ImpC
VEERPPLSAASLLDQALEETERRSPRRLEPQALSGGFDWHKLVRDIVEPYLLPAAAPERAGLVACVDAAIARSMSALLHEGSFQRLEAAWRGLQWLLRQLETGPDLKLCLLDVAKQELSDDLVAGAALEASRMYRLVVEQTTATAGGQPWALLVGDYTFDASEGDVRLLGHLARLGAAAGAPFVSAASGQIVGCAAPDQTPDPSEWARPEEETSAEGWSALRQSPESACLGLVWPRFLLRLPYGKKTDPIETFEYEEMPGEPHHNDYLWGNPALVCAAMLGQAFSRSGWAMRAGEVARLSGLPVHVCRVDGEPRAQPCGELLLNERAIQTVAGYGLMPLVSFRGRDEVALASFQSLNNGPLGGRWR